MSTASLCAVDCKVRYGGVDDSEGLCAGCCFGRGPKEGSAAGVRYEIVGEAMQARCRPGLPMRSGRGSRPGCRQGRAFGLDTG